MLIMQYDSRFTMRPAWFHFANRPSSLRFPRLIPGFIQQRNPAESSFVSLSLGDVAAGSFRLTLWTPQSESPRLAEIAATLIREISTKPVATAPSTIDRSRLCLIFTNHPILIVARLPTPPNISPFITSPPSNVVARTWANDSANATSFAYRVAKYIYLKRILTNYTI